MEDRKEFRTSGTTLMSGEYAEVKITPNKGEGIRFFNTNFSSFIEAKTKNVVSTQNCTTVSNGEFNLSLIEHFMAACAILNITDIDVLVDNSELPIFDGSAKKWVELFKENGYQKEFAERKNLEETVWVMGNNGSSVTMLPLENEFNVFYLTNFEHKDLKNKWVSLKDIPIEEIIEARTFGYLKDLEKIQAMGLAKGVSIENTVGLTEDGYTTELRSDLEPLKHKILDFIGDFYLTGENPFTINAEVLANQAGHYLHVEFAKKFERKK